MRFINKTILLFVIAASVVLYIAFGFFLTKGTIVLMLWSYVLLFLGYLYFLYYNRYFNNLNRLAVASILFRLCFLVSFPLLSETCIRVFWDGKMLISGLDPYQILPIDASEKAAMIKSNITHYLLYELKSKLTYSPNAPITILLSSISVLFFPENLLGAFSVMRLFIIAADIGIIILGIRVLKKLNLAPSSILIYALNPLIVISLTANIHFEGVMIFFILLAIWYIILQKYHLSAVCMCCAALVNPFALVILPFISIKLPSEKRLGYLLISIGLFILVFLPFSFQNYFNGLYTFFSNYHFNAGMIVLFNKLNQYFQIINNDIYLWIGLTGIGLITLILFIIKTKKEWLSIFNTLALSLSIILFLSSNVYPNYIIILVFLSVFCRYHYIIIWSFLIMVAIIVYLFNPSGDNLIMLIIEYSVVIGFFIYETSMTKLLTHYLSRIFSGRG